MIDTRLPLTDIHRHLDGNIRAQTILDLGRQFNLTLPAETLETLIPCSGHVERTGSGELSEQARLGREDAGLGRCLSPCRL